MKARKTLPVGAMFMVLVITLALVGVGYALWSETLTISGTVTTGEVDVEFSQYPVEECVDVNGVLTCPEPAGKEAAANCTVAWSNTATDPNDNGNNLLQVTVTGMYPSYHCKVAFDVTSTGNVPVHVWLPVAAPGNPAWVATNFTSCYTDGVQLHQGQSTGKCTMDIHFTNQTAPPENSVPYTFGWTILATQWNEDPFITVTGGTLNFGPTGWGGWSCPVTHPYVVSATTTCTLPHTQYLWQPGATAGGFTYPSTPFGYTYTPPEEGSIVQNGGTGQSCNIILKCSDQP